MASILRLGSRQVLNQLLRNEKSGMLGMVRVHTLQPHAPPPPSPLGHDERNAKLGRPLSPHLTIYAPQLTSMSSITHRGTGIALAGYTILFSAGAVALPESIPHYIDALAAAQIGGAPIFIAKLMLSFPFSYHFWNGIRHLSWDMAIGVRIKQVYLTGYLMLAMSFVTSIALACM